MSEVATVAAWSNSELGMTEGAWIAWPGEAIDDVQPLRLGGYHYVPADQFFVSSAGELIVVDSAPQVYVRDFIDTNPEDSIRAVLADLGFTNTLSAEPEFLGISLINQMSQMFFSDHFVDIRFISSQIGSQVFVARRRWGTTELTLQINRASLSEIKLVYPDGTVCEYDERFLRWLVAGEYAEYSCES